jgi:hypothetical protein
MERSIIQREKGNTHIRFYYRRKPAERKAGKGDKARMDWDKILPPHTCLGHQVTTKNPDPGGNRTRRINAKNAKAAQRSQSYPFPLRLVYVPFLRTLRFFLNISVAQIP